MTNVDTSTLDPSDVQEYRGYFKLVYNRECTLTHDELVSLVFSTDDEMEPKDWAEAMLAAEEHGPENDDRSADSDVVDETALLTSSAYEYASKWDDQFIADLETNAQAALENKRGAAVLMLDLIRMHGKETILNNWPVPGSKATESQNPHRYNKTTKDAVTGETKTGTNNGDWYFDLFDASKPGRAFQLKMVSWKGAKAGEKGKHILPRHAAMAGDEIKLIAEKGKLDSERNTKKAGIVRAVNTIFQMHRINTETQMEVELITQDNGAPVESQKLLYAHNKKDRKQFRILTIGQLLALSVDKAKAAGGEYAHVIGTTGRGPKAKGGEAVDYTIKSIKTFDSVTAEYATFFEKLRKDTKAMNTFLTHLNEEGGEDMLLSLNSIMTDIDSYLSKPAYQKRLQTALMNERKTANGKAA